MFHEGEKPNLIITVIRHAKVDFIFPRSYGPQGQIEASRAYNECPIDISGIETIETDAKIFVSTLPRSEATALIMFKDRPLIRSGLFDEVPLAPFTRRNIRLPSILWDVIGRFLWNFRNGGQPETRSDTDMRADRAIDLMESTGEDCYLVSHAFFMRTLFRRLRKRGYRSASRFGLIHNLSRFVYEK